MAIGENLTIADGFGATRFPVDEDLVGTDVTAANLDPGQDAIIGLLKAAINADCGDAWKRITQGFSFTHFTRKVNLSDSLPVNFTIDALPDSGAATQMLFDWPVLAVYPVGSPEDFELTMSLQGTRQNWAVAYIIGPLEIAWQRKLGRGFCRLVYRSIRRALWKGYHPAYQNGQRQFFGQFSEIKTTGCEGPGVMELPAKDGALGYYGIVANLQTVERTVHDEFDETDDPSNYAYVPTGTGATLDEWTQTSNEFETENQTADTVGFYEDV
jgi:hypothetical protein